MKTRQLPRGPPAPQPLLMLPLLLMLLLAGTCANGYKPVVIVHGLFENPDDFKTLSRFITEAHPGTQVSIIDLFNKQDSLQPLWKQVKGFKKAILPIMREAPDGGHLLCYSQGGLICRAFLATTRNHNVHTFISLASPQAGQYGATEYMSIFHRMPRTLYRLCYNRYGQKISICNYWNDPYHRSKYLRSNIFLPELNGERPHKDMKSWKRNFLRLKKLVLIGGPDDGVITPWQSSHFGFYDKDGNVVDMRDQRFYKRNTFGLKTLDARGDLSLCERSKVNHTQWRFDRDVFSDCIEGWLV